MESVARACIPAPTYGDALSTAHIHCRPMRPLPAIPKSRPSFLDLSDSPLSPEPSILSHSPEHYSALSPRFSDLPPAYSPRAPEPVSEKHVLPNTLDRTTPSPAETPSPPVPEAAEQQLPSTESSAPSRNERLWLPPTPTIPPPPPPSPPAITIIPSPQPMSCSTNAHARSLSLPLAQVTLEPSRLRSLSTFSPVSPVSILSVECIAPSSPLAAAAVSPADYTRPSSFVPPPMVPPMVSTAPQGPSSRRLVSHAQSRSLETVRDDVRSGSSSSVDVSRSPAPAHLLPRATLTPPLPYERSAPLYSPTPEVPRRARTPGAERSRAPTVRRVPSMPMPHIRPKIPEPPMSAPVPKLYFTRTECSHPEERDRALHQKTSQRSGSASEASERVVQPTISRQCPLQSAPPHIGVPASGAARSRSPSIRPQTAGTLTFLDKPILGSFRIRNRSRTIGAARSVPYDS